MVWEWEDLQETPREKGAKMEPFILNLPYEILADIFEMTLQTYDGELDQFTLGSLSRTCRKFRNIAKPILFRQLDFSWVEWAHHWGYPMNFTAPCHLILSLARQSLGDLVRVADLWSLSDDFCQHNMCPWVCYDYDDIEASDWDPDGCFVVLLDYLGVGVASRYTPQKRQDNHKYLEPGHDLEQQADQSLDADQEPEADHDLEGDQEHDAEWDPNQDGEFEDEEKFSRFTIDHVVFAMALVVMPNLVKLRLPIGRSSLQLRLDRPRLYPIVIPGGLGPCVVLSEHHFPSLSRLKELELLSERRRPWEENDSSLHADHFSWIVHRSPQFRILRLGDFDGLLRNMEDFERPCQNITTLSLINCKNPLDEVADLVWCCPQLKRFKMSNCKNPHTRNTVYTRAQGASIMLDILAQNAPQIEKVFLGDCTHYFWKGPSLDWMPADEVPVLPTGGLGNLKTLGLTRQNLNQEQAPESYSNILTKLITDCPSLESLQVFDADWDSGVSKKLEPTLKGWLEGLAEELDLNKESRLKELKLWYRDIDSYERSTRDAEHVKNYKKTCWRGGTTFKPREHVFNEEPMRRLEESGLVRLYQSFGVKLTLEREQGYKDPRRGKFSQPPSQRDPMFEHAVFPGIPGIDPDETLWSGKPKGR
ncbi:hypothetical protein V8F20_008563 [Naviculisporaceae sp. PSN 640]